MTRAVPARTFAAIIVLLGLAASVAVGHQHQRNNESVIREGLRDTADRAAAAVTAKLKPYEYGLAGRAPPSSAQERVDLARPLRCVHPLARLPGEFQARKGSGSCAASRPPGAGLCRSARREITPSFRVRELSKHDGERFLIELIEPLARTRRAGPRPGVGSRGGARAPSAPWRPAVQHHRPHRARAAPAGRAHRIFALSAAASGRCRAEHRRGGKAATLGWVYAVVSLKKVLETSTSTTGSPWR